MSLTDFINFLVAMIAITNPIGNCAIFIGLSAEKSIAEQRKTAMLTAISVTIILLLTTWIGSAILDVFGISVPAFQLAGGLIIILLGLSMLQSKKSEMSHTHDEHQQAKKKDSIAVVPMAIPIIAGPGAITTILANSHKFLGVSGKLYSSLADILVTLIILLTLYFSGHISRFLGDAGIKIATRVMGLILVAMAMQMVADGLTTLFPAWV